MAISSVRTGTVSSDISLLASQLLAKDRVRVKSLQSNQNALNTRSSVLGTLKTKLLSLHDVLDTMAQVGTLSPFDTKVATSSDPVTLTATANANATPGTYSITVQALAKNAEYVSDVLTDTNTNIAAGDKGNNSFAITVAGTTYNFSVNIGNNDTNQTILDNLVSAINTAAGAAVTAVRVQTQTGQSRLQITSKTTGTSNDITFTDSSKNTLADIGIYHATPTAATSTTGGYIFANLGNHELDAKFVQGGLTYYREANTVSDLLTGVTLTLKNTSASAVTVTVAADQDNAVAKLKDFIAKYNDVIDYLGQQTLIDPKAGTRGPLAVDPVYNRLAGAMRATASARVSSQASGTPDSLAALGIRADRTGKLSITNETTLRQTFLANPDAVATLFNAGGGVATSLESFVNQYSNAAGEITHSQNSLSTRITSLGQQIKRANDLLARKQSVLEQKLARQQDMLNKLQAQQQQINTVLAAFSGH